MKLGLPGAAVAGAPNTGAHRSIHTANAAAVTALDEHFISSGQSMALGLITVFRQGVTKFTYWK